MVGDHCCAAAEVFGRRPSGEMDCPLGGIEEVEDEFGFEVYGVRGIEAELELVPLCGGALSMNLFGPQSRPANLQLSQRSRFSQLRASGSHLRYGQPWLRPFIKILPFAHLLLSLSA